MALPASYSLITLTVGPGDGLIYEPQDLISVHRLIQATTPAQLTGGQRATVRDEAAHLLQAALPDDPERMALNVAAAAPPQRARARSAIAYDLAVLRLPIVARNASTDDDEVRRGEVSASCGFAGLFPSA